MEERKKRGRKPGVPVGRYFTIPKKLVSVNIEMEPLEFLTDYCKENEVPRSKVINDLIKLMAQGKITEQLAGINVKDKAA